MTTVRRGLKSAAELVLGHRTLLSLRLARRRGRRLVLSYHNIVSSTHPPTSGDRSLHLPFERFRAQLDAITAAGLQVARLDSPFELSRASIAITFDDAYAGALALALPELERRRFPSTVFVAPGLLGRDAPWWDLLATPSSGEIPPDRRSAALDLLAGDGDAILRAAAERGWPRYPAAPEHRIAREDELRAALESAPHATVAAHSWSHANLSALDHERLHDELTRPMEWLREEFPERTLNLLAYPYGLESPATRRAVRGAGYASAYRVDGGWSRSDDDPSALPRLNVSSGVSDPGFRARLGGWLD